MDKYEKEVSVYWKLPSGLKKECKTATKVLKSVIKELKSDLSGSKEMKEKEKTNYQQHIASSSGIIIIRFFKVAFIGSLRYGNGLMFSRLPNGRWSAPACVETGGIGIGASVGLAVSNEVFFMNEAACKAFKKGGNVTVGADVQLTILSMGRGAEGDLALGKTRQGAHIYSFSKSAGLYGAVEVTSGGIIDRRKDNQKYYGDHIKIGDILDGRVLAQEEDVKELYEILNSGGANVQNHGSTSSDDVSPFPSPRGPPDATQQQQQQQQQQIQQQQGPPPPTGPAPVPNFNPRPPPTPSSPRGNKYKALYDFDQPQDGELGFKTGDIVTVLETGPTMWWIGQNDQGKQGKVPGNYLVPLQ